MPDLLLTAIAVALRVLSNPLGNVFQKKLSAERNHPLLVNFITYFILAICCLPLAAGIPWRGFPDAFWLYSLAAGLAGAVGNAFLVKALQGGDLSVLGPVNAYKSVVGLLAGMVLLREMPSPSGLLGMALIIWGSYFVLDTLTEKFSWSLFRRKDIKYRLWALVLTAIEAALIKQVILHSSSLVAFIMWCWFGATFALALVLGYRLQVGRELARLHPPSYLQYLALVACIGTMQFTTNFVLERMQVGFALALFQLSTLVSIGLGYHVFREQGIRKKLLGALIMMAGSALIFLYG